MKPVKSRAGVRGRRGRILVPLRVGLVLAVGVLGGGLGAADATAGTPIKSCAFIQRYFVAVGARGTSCRTAERVARRYMAQAIGRVHPRFPRRELGFRCRRINVTNAGGGWYAQCRKGRALVSMLPT